MGDHTEKRLHEETASFAMKTAINSNCKKKQRML